MTFTYVPLPNFPSLDQLIIDSVEKKSYLRGERLVITKQLAAWWWGYFKQIGDLDEDLREF